MHPRRTHRRLGAASHRVHPRDRRSVQGRRQGAAITALILAIVGTIVGFVVFLAVVVDAVDDAVDEIGSSGDYAVTIDGTRQAKNYEGKPALVVDYTFTNSGDDATSFLVGVTATVFQDGVELESTVLDTPGKAADNSMKDVKPDKSIKIQEAYVLDGKADVTVEVTETFGNDPIAEETIVIK